MKTLQSFVTLVAQDRVADARNLLTQELSERVLGALGQAKQELAANLFGGSPELAEETEEKEQLGEMFTRKHFREVADKIRSHPDQNTRNTLAKHHAEIFAASNPRFDHKKFFAAAGAHHEHYESVELDEKKNLTEDVIDEQYHVYDNGGKTADRYTVFTKKDHAEGKRTGRTVDALGMDEHPTHPQGFSQHTSAQVGRHLGKKIPYKSLPDHLQKHIKSRLGESVQLDGIRRATGLK